MRGEDGGGDRCDDDQSHMMLYEWLTYSALSNSSVDMSV